MPRGFRAFVGLAATPMVWWSVLLLLFVATTRANAAKPPLGEGHLAFDGILIPWFVPSGMVTVLLFAGYLIGGAAVLVRLWLRPVDSARRWEVAALAVIALIGAPIGSVDHIRYAAYGRIAAQGGDPYSASPIDWAQGLDPITSAVQPPWQDDPSIYGPVGTAAFAVASVVGGDSLRDTVWVWQVIVVLAWLAVRWLLRRLSDDPEVHARIDVLWTLNPVVFGVVVLGAHVDVLAAAFVLAALVLMNRNSLATGVFVGAALSTKITYGVVLLAVVWAWRHVGLKEMRRNLFRLAGGVLLVTLPCYLVAGRHAFRQFTVAVGEFSDASPWSPVWRGLRQVLPEWAVATIVFAVAACLMILACWATVRVVQRRGLAREIACPAQRVAVVVTFALITSYLLFVPFAMPWFAVLTFALLPVLLRARWDRFLLVLSVLLALAHVPGRATGMSPRVEDWTLAFRSNVVPYLIWVCLAFLVHFVVGALRRSEPDGGVLLAAEESGDDAPRETA